MNFTSRMLALLEAVRRERNGLAADTMHYYGVRYGLNYGVSLPTLRRIAKTEACDSDFAGYLWQQDVRELRLAALWIVDPACLTLDKAACWATRIVNSELAEEAAFALLSRVPHIREIFCAWTAADQPLLLQYAALLAAARHPELMADSASDDDAANSFAFRANAAAQQPSSHSLSAWLAPMAGVVQRNPDDRLTAQAAVALLAALAQKKENRSEILRMIGSLGTSPSADFIYEETAWRLEA